MPGRGRSRGVVAKRVEDLAARRDGIDAEVAERRIRENDALEHWVSLAVEREEIASTRDDEMARLEAERSRVQDDAAQRVALVDAQQAAVLLRLSRDSRTAHQLSALFELPLKQVRDMVRVAKAAEASGGRAESAPRTPRSSGQATPTVPPGGPAADDVARGLSGDLDGSDRSDGDGRDAESFTTGSGGPGTAPETGSFGGQIRLT